MKIETLHTTNTIRTVTGIYVDIVNPTPEMFCIEDIAHSLSHQCRFGGHIPKFFSVAQHSYNVSKQVPAKHQMAALMHDAAEAYVLDMPRPIKWQLTNYKAIENNLMYIIAEKFGFEYPLANEIKKADELALEFEWNNLVIRQSEVVTAMLPEVAKRFFLDRFYTILNQVPPSTSFIL